MLKRQIFRDESVERLSSPEALDQLMKVVTPKSLFSILALGMITISGGIWSIVGRIPISVDGQGVLIYPSNIVPLQIKSAGQLNTLTIKANDIVKKGQVIGTIDQSELRKQLQQQQSKLQELQTQNQTSTVLQARGTNQDKQTIVQQRQAVTARIQELQILAPTIKVKSQQSIQQQRLQIEQKTTSLKALSPTIKDKSRAALQQQRLSLNEQIKAATNQLPILKTRSNNLKNLYAQGVITQEVSLQAEQAYQKKQEEIAQYNTQLKDIEVKENEIEERYLNNQNEVTKNQAELQRLTLEETNTQEAYLRNQNEIAKLQTELKDLSSREANQSKQNYQDSTARSNQITELQREIARLETQIGNNGEIISQYNGRVLEITQSPGQVIMSGSRIATIEIEKTAQSLVGVTYFPIAEGKKIKPGMSIQITPQTVKREQFGGIVGKVTEVSSFPITSENIAHEVGNAELAEALAKKREGLIKVSAQLALDPKTTSGYQWSSSIGPTGKITSGTTTTVRVKTEERAPITFVFPILRSVSGWD